MEIKYKSIAKAVTDVDTKGRTVVGYFSIFGNIDSDGDIIQRGAYTKTIAERGPQGSNKIWHLIDHYFSLSHAIAKPKILIEDEKGLRFETVFPDTKLASDILKLYEAGHITDHSVGFQTINSSISTVNGEEINTITEIKLYEGSSVLLGSNPMANFEAIKSAEYIMRHGTLTDAGFLKLQEQIEAIKALIESAAVKQTEPGRTTQEVKEIFLQTFKSTSDDTRRNQINGGSTQK